MHIYCALNFILFSLLFIINPSKAIFYTSNICNPEQIIMLYAQIKIDNNQRGLPSGKVRTNMKLTTLDNIVAIYTHNDNL